MFGSNIKIKNKVQQNLEKTLRKVRRKPWKHWWNYGIGFWMGEKLFYNFSRFKSCLSYLKIYSIKWLILIFQLKIFSIEKISCVIKFFKPVLWFFLNWRIFCNVKFFYTFSTPGIFFSNCKNFPQQYFVVVAKKPPMCQIMRFSLYCINGVTEGRHTD